MSDPTPDQLLRLARAAMPKPTDIDPYDETTQSDGEWRIIETAYSPPNDKIVARHWFSQHESNFDQFDPINNPAHAWAVECWLFTDGQGNKKPYRGIEKDSRFDCPPRYTVVWEAGLFDEPTKWSNYADNLSAAIAVLRRIEENE